MNGLYRAIQLIKVPKITKTEILRLSQQQCDISTPVKKPWKRVTKSRKAHEKELEEYMTSTDDLKEIKAHIPVRLLKRNRKAPDDLYLIDCNIGKQIADSIKEKIVGAKRTIIETNPGFGFISKELLKSGVNELQLYETTVYFRDKIVKLDQDYPGCTKVFNRDFFSIWKLSYQDRHDNGDRVKTMLSGVKTKQWDDEPTMTVIGSLASSNFIRHLILSLIFQFGVMTYGRCELYLILPPPLYLQLTAGPETGYLLYRASSVLFQLLCDFEILEKIPRKAFLPWDNTRDLLHTARMAKISKIDPESMYLTRMEFKRNLPVPMHQLKHLWYFVVHMMVSRTNRVIPALEKCIPGCGARLILPNNDASQNKNSFPDIGIFTQIGQLNAQQILNVYLTFSNCPEYSESSFIAAMEMAMLKMASIEDMDEIQEEQPNHDVETDPHEDDVR